MRRVVFRCDASSAIGGGHVARCMALARACAQRGAEVHLLTRALPARVRELLVEPAGARVHDLETIDITARLGHDARGDGGPVLDHAGWLPVTQSIDAAQSIAALRTLGDVDALVLDHYALDARWEADVRPHARKLLVIDDLADRDHDCDALLDQNFALRPEARYEQRVKPGTELLVGPQYALLREEFAAARGRLAERDGALRRIFVCFGGFDAVNQTGRALDALDAAALEDVAIDVVIGSDHPARERAERFAASGAGRRIHYDATDLAGLMSPADLAIGAGGVMNWERAALRLPTILTSVAENQRVIAEDLAADRACIYMGFAHEWRAETLASLVRALAATPTLLRALSRRTGALTDGRGADRVAARLFPDPIQLRRASAADCDALHAWRNTEQSRRYSGDPSPIPLERHRAWLARVLDDPQTALLVGQREGKAVGVLRYDVEGPRAVVSIYLAPGMHGQGIGAALLRAGTDWLREHRPDVREIRAEIRRDNAASMRAFESAGYTPESAIYTLDTRHD